MHILEGYALPDRDRITSKTRRDAGRCGHGSSVRHCLSLKFAVLDSLASLLSRSRGMAISEPPSASVQVAESRNVPGRIWAGIAIVLAAFTGADTSALAGLEPYDESKLPPL